MEESEWDIFKSAAEAAGLTLVPILGRPIQVHDDLSFGYCESTGRCELGHLAACDYEDGHTGKHTWEECDHRA